jgi:hypothetical protein
MVKNSKNFTKDFIQCEILHLTFKSLFLNFILFILGFKKKIRVLEVEIG